MLPVPFRQGSHQFNVAGRTAFITGAARGIGAGIAERLHSRGANVALVGLEPERLEALAERLGDRTACFEADVTDFDALDRAVRGTIDRFGGIDIAIANAGIFLPGTLATAPIAHVERVLAVNLLGVWRTDRAVVRHVVDRRGYLLNIASMSAIMNIPVMGPYTTAKAGVEALTNVLRMELRPSGARVGCAYFGLVDTDLMRANYTLPSLRTMMSARMPKFLRSPAPIGTAIDAVEKGIEKRSARIWSPRVLGPMIGLRGVVQPLSEWLVDLDKDRLSETMRLAESPSEHENQDPILGLAARVIQ